MTRRRALSWTLFPILAVTLAVGGSLPAAALDHPWDDPSLSPDERATLLVDALTLDQKIQQIAVSRFLEDDEGDTVVINRRGNSAYQSGRFEPQGTLPGCTWQDTGRQIRGIEELGIPTVRMTNGGTGVKGGSCGNDPEATGLPSTPAAAATFDRGLNYELGRILGEETRAFAHHAMLGPGMNLIRHPYGGRTYEYFSEDPLLTGALAVEQVRGIQDQGVHAQPKHLAGNEQETERWTMGVQVPPRAMNELYMLPFGMVVRDAGAASVMCSFPHVNGPDACHSPELLQDTLRDRWDFDGYVMSDRRAVHDTVEAIKAGVNVELDWAPQHYTPELVTAALDAGDIVEEDLDVLLHERYRTMFEFGHMDEPFDEFAWEGVDLAANGASAREIAEQGTVLLKNDDDFLPLTGAEESIALIGVEWFAGEAKLSPRSIRDNNVNVRTPYTVTPEEGLENVIDELGHDVRVTYDDGRDPEQAAELAAESDVVLLMVGDNPHETADRETLGFPPIDLDTDRDGEDIVEQEPLVEAVLEANADDTVVVLKTSGMVLMPWLDDVPAVLEAWYPGMEDGNAVARILYGEVNPSGKLPVTFGVSDREAAFATEEQFPGVRVDNGETGGPGAYGRPGVHQLVATYREGLEVGYRWYEANDVEPVFPFGHGLSYTTFDYSDLSVTASRGESGHQALTVTFTVTNTGDVAGAEAAQVYLTLPDEAGQPSKRLVEFAKPYLEPGAAEQVTVTVDGGSSSLPFSYFAPADPEDLTNWASGDWWTAAGTYTVHVGGSSADTPLVQHVELAAEGPLMPRTEPDHPWEPGTPRPPGRLGFFLTNSWGGGDADYAFMYGRHTDEVLVGDWNGDGRDSITVRRGKTYFVNNHPRGGPAESVFHYGRADDVVLVGDWNGDGTDTLAVRRGNAYHVKNSLRGGDADVVVRYGRADDDVLVGDWNGDGRDTFAVRRGKTYYVKNSLRGGDADVVFQYGKADDMVYAGDWDGNGRDSFLVRRGKEYHVKNSLRGGPADIVMLYGRATDEVYIGDWDGNGTDTVGVRRTPATVAAAEG